MVGSSTQRIATGVVTEIAGRSFRSTADLLGIRASSGSSQMHCPRLYLPLGCLLGTFRAIL
jgi:hypothetical protein